MDSEVFKGDKLAGVLISTVFVYNSKNAVDTFLIKDIEVKRFFLRRQSPGLKLIS